ncbi:hypothetical protein KXR87_02080 [Yokenella regensburgei]|uniref:hypothetical protein n=1 Tax=Yokenella regensburgei TaxID=158877 RepID=UPI003F14804A
MKILGLDEYRVLRGNGALKYFELEGMPGDEWRMLFERQFADQGTNVWIEGYCIVLQCTSDEVPAWLTRLQAKSDEVTAQLLMR